ncbi:UMP kinase [Rhodospira trueperi]|uniref:Uridylate kinase n=1 Tax=Rhodospira trueperi TaxID=69960 RepID=A0A1G7FT70_9PROT|nr:UMP kinase [Rhodospira trueperi]SDE79117.1 uridylate kinase [Rhodospira trueperi]
MTKPETLTTSAPSADDPDGDVACVPDPAARSFRRVLVKLSGEGLMGDQGYGIDLETVGRVAREIKEVNDTGVELCLVIGGGNIFRGMAQAAKGMDRTSADYMGMLATVMNALAVQNFLEAIGVPTRVQSAIPMDTVCEPFNRRQAVQHLDMGRVVIFAAGTGNPFFTTDTAAALRAVEMNCDALLKATQVDGVYDSDPKTNPGAKRYATLTYGEMLRQDLRVMDTSAIALARDNGIPILVFSLGEAGALGTVLRGAGRYTIIREET